MSITTSAPDAADAVDGPVDLKTRPSAAPVASPTNVTLVLLCAVAFLDFIDITVVNIALPSIRRDLHFSIQSLQWVLSGYLLTYGGFMLLGGRVADLVGRRRVLVAGVWVFGLSSLAGGLSPSSGVLVAARLVQGGGAAMMLPAAMSILTTTFRDGASRHRAMGAWGAVAGIAASIGIVLGGLLSEGPGWRWVLLINPPVCLLVLFAVSRLIKPERLRAPLRNFDIPGAVLVTAGMLTLVFALVRAPDVGWGSGSTIVGLAVAALLLTAFAVNERRRENPLVPFSILRVRGIAAADTALLLGSAGFIAMFFFLTLYLQNVLDFSPIQAGVAYLPFSAGVIVAAGIASFLFPRVGTRPVIVAGAIIACAGIYWLSRVPLHGTYAANVLPGIVIGGLGTGAVFIGATAAGNAGVPSDKAGLAASMQNASQQLGTALGLAVLSALAAARTHGLLAAHASQGYALTAGVQRALVAASIFLIGAAVAGLRATNARGGSPLG